MKRVYLHNLPDEWSDLTHYIDPWLSAMLEDFGLLIRRLNYSFVSDEIMLAENRRLLNHDYYTDIITYGEVIDGKVSGDFILSVDRIRDNGKQLNNNEIDERDRVVVHGLLHLCGYNDATEEEKLIMRQLEDKYLALRP